MTNTGNLGTIEVTNPVLTVAPLKEDTEMLRATEKITALYCRLSVEDLKDDKNGGKGDVSNSIQNQKDILLRYAKEHRFPNPTFFVDDGYSGTNYDRPVERPVPAGAKFFPDGLVYQLHFPEIWCALYRHQRPL